jgi:predicted NAD/FAD-binding protein
MTAETKEVLGALYGAPTGVAEVTIATLGYWERTALVEAGAIASFENQTGSGSEEVMESPVEVVITRSGRKAIRRYAREFADHIGARTNLDRLRREHEAWIASL